MKLKKIPVSIFRYVHDYKKKNIYTEDVNTQLCPAISKAEVAE